MTATIEQEFRPTEELVADRQAHFISTAVMYYKKPLQLVKAKGCLVWDEQGREYLDCIGGIVCISAGHNHPRIKEKLINMLQNDEIQHTSMLYPSTYPNNLAKKLLSEASPGINRAAFTNSGSEANETAFLAARNATGETIVMNIKHGYHGGTSGVMANCGHASWRFRSQPMGPSVSVEAPNCYRCPFGQQAGSCHMECVKNVEQTIQTSTHGKIAAFIAEPVMGVGGFITPPDEYFQEVIKVIHQYGGKYISDEVQTGAARSGQSFLLTKSLGIDADMITMAKGLGNGAPIGAVLMKQEISDTLKGKLFFNTFGGDPFQTAQALLTMEIIEEENLLENTRDMGQYLRQGLEDLMNRHPLIGDVRGRGLLLGFELVKDRTTKAYATEEAADLMERCKDKGVLIGKGGLFGNVIRLAPPLSINREQVDLLLKVIDEALTDMERK